ncbi:Hsp20/alpha crystallin family protein [Niallia sp. XMNu-256]|uniref:Hsp20/alpha crystallin family protein n=1 Tax=Niallia sp. XMNu-256 TaxID=3082444 RepID=UPI0030CD66C0
MDIEKMRKWLEITNEYKKTDFWTRVLQERYPNENIKEDKYQPKCDMYQNESYNFIIIEIPGVTRENLSLSLISNTQLKINGKCQPIFLLEKEIRRERVYGDFQRIIDLPEPTKPELMHIQIDNGLLLVSYPRQTVEPIKLI